MYRIYNVADTINRIFFPISGGFKASFEKTEPSSPCYSMVQHDCTQKNILLAQGFPIVRQYLSKIFRELGYKVVAVSSGKSAVRRLSPKFDLIFFDASLTDINGCSALQTIRQKQASYQRAPAPIIASMATSDIDLSPQYIAAGANAIFKSSDGATENDFKHFFTKFWLLTTSLNDGVKNV
jgi:CheY-like chemotaxis protein